MKRMFNMISENDIEHGCLVMMFNMLKYGRRTTK